jgi:hypothetical protein
MGFTLELRVSAHLANSHRDWKNAGMKHAASPERRALQIQAFYEKLPRHASGYMTKDGRAAWLSWLGQQELSESYALALMRGKGPALKPFNAEHAAKCAEYLKRHGYQVIEPK